MSKHVIVSCLTKRYLRCFTFTLKLIVLLIVQHTHKDVLKDRTLLLYIKHVVATGNPIYLMFAV